MATSANTLEKQPPKVFYKKNALKNLAKFTGEDLCQSLFLNKVAGFSSEFCKILRILFTEHLRTIASDTRPLRVQFINKETRTTLYVIINFEHSRQLI